MSVIELPIPESGHADIPEGVTAYTNFDHTWYADGRHALEIGETYHQHAAWDFCGYIWKTEGSYAECVWQYNEPVACYGCADLDALVEHVNNEWGHA